MKIVKHEPDGGATITFTEKELGTIGLVGVEFTQGACAPDDGMWETLTLPDREEVIALFDAIP